MAEPLLSVTELRKSFGAVAANDGVELEIAPGALHAVIGPNGAGKTTLVGQLAGEIAPDTGTILFDGRDVTGLPVERRSGLGIARSFQITSLFPRLSVLDNVALAVQAHAGHSFRFWAPAAREARVREPARAVLEQVGLGGRAALSAAALSHGEQRQLEIALALATRPRLLLLDEPMAGLGRDDGARMIDLLSGLKGRITMLLVEHDMDAVFALADTISVMVYGRVIASGPPEAIRADAEVRRAYLGEEDAESPTPAPEPSPGAARGEVRPRC